MPFISISELKPSSGTHSSDAPSQSLTLSVHKSNGNLKGAMAFRMGAELAESLRFHSNDRVDILFDQESRKGKLVRVAEGGWKLRQSSRNRLTVVVTFFPGMPLVERPTECSNVTLTPDGCLFDLPKNAVFEQNKSDNSVASETEDQSSEIADAEPLDAFIQERASA